MSDPKRIDPYDIDALEKSVNDSATRVSTIWISFLLFGLYLLTTATTVKQIQLLLDAPLKLPVLNIELPLWGFFFLAPMLFVVLHVYVLLQVLLLGRTTAAYDAAVARARLTPDENASLRQRLANTLFAQIFAGSPRERHGFIGALLKGIVWITLAVGPLAVLLAFQFRFLAYHSHLATWTHRLMIFLELGAFFLIWPLALDARKDFSLHNIRHGIARAMAYPTTIALLLFWPLVRRKWGFDWPRHQPLKTLPRHRLQVASVMIGSVIAAISFALGTFPGEPHRNLLTGNPLNSTQCYDWPYRHFWHYGYDFDRLTLRGIDVVDDGKLATIVEHNSWRNLPASEGERTQDFRYRNLSCADLVSSDFRRVDLTGAQLTGADFSFSSLDGGSLGDAILENAVLTESNLSGSNFNRSQLKGANLLLANLRGAKLVNTQLRGAVLSYALLQDASLRYAQLQGASMIYANLRGADLSEAQLQGANLENSNIEAASFDGAILRGAVLDKAKSVGASYDGAQMEGSSLIGAQLQAASFVNAALQAARIQNSNLDQSTFEQAFLWGTFIDTCSSARVVNASFTNHIRSDDDDSSDAEATPENIERLIKLMIRRIPDAERRSDVERSTRDSFEAATVNAEQWERIWLDCQISSVLIDKKRSKANRAKMLRNVICSATKDAASIARGIVRNWLSPEVLVADREIIKFIARGLLGEDGEPCPPVTEYDQATLATLREAAGPPPPPAK